MKKILLRNEDQIKDKIIESFQFISKEMNEVTNALKRVFQKTKPEFFFRELVPIL